MTWRVLDTKPAGIRILMEVDLQDLEFLITTLDSATLSYDKDHINKEAIDYTVDVTLKGLKTLIAATKESYGIRSDGEKN